MTELAEDLIVAAKTAVSDGVIMLCLRAPDGRALPSWSPGAHVDLELTDELVRQYSLCGDTADRTGYSVAVLREPAGRGASRYVHDRLAVGDHVRVRGPRNHFALVDAPRYLFIAGGVGITPLLPMLREVEARGAGWRLLYGGRQRATMAFLPELSAYGERVTVCPQEETGLLDLAAVLGSPEPDTAIYACGPEPLLQAVEGMCAPWPRGALHVERFSPQPRDDGPDVPFEVELAQSGTTLSVPADRSILDVVEDAGVSVMSSCTEGTCGTCETMVCAGNPDHRDSVLSEEEREAGESMMICVSRSLGGRLVLDL